MTENTTPENTISRREALKIAGVSSGALPVGSGVVSATSDPTDTVRLVEASLLYDVSAPESADTFYETATVCDRPDYAIDQARRTVRPTETPSAPQVFRTFRNNSAAVNFGGVSPMPARSLGGAASDFAVAGFGTGIEPSSVYVLAEPTTVPSFQARTESGSVVLQSGDSRKEVASRERASLTLESVQITLEKTVVLDEKAAATDDMKPYLRAPKKERTTESITVEPALHAVNHGELRIRDEE